jgi:hypothetical protein
MNFGFPGEIEEIAMAFQYIETAAVVVAFLLALAWIACEWNDA